MPTTTLQLCYLENLIALLNNASEKKLPSSKSVQISRKTFIMEQAVKTLDKTLLFKADSIESYLLA